LLHDKKRMRVTELEQRRNELQSYSSPFLRDGVVLLHRGKSASGERKLSRLFRNAESTKKDKYQGTPWLQNNCLEKAARISNNFAAA
jgi:hypothetical protein